MRGPSHVLSPTGEWVDFEYLDPAAVDAVKALLTRDDQRDSVLPTTESGPGAVSPARGPASTYVGGS